MKKILAAIATTAALAALSAPASAASIPYSPDGYNPQTYTFEVAHTGPVNLYFAGADAGNDNTIGVAVNGVDVASGLFDDHSTTIGTLATLGKLQKGDIVTFTLDTNGTIFSSVSADNVGKDGANPLNDNHIYADEYHGGAAGPNLPKSGLYLAFEDLPLTTSDLDFNDETFVATDLKIVNPCGGVPEPATWAAMIVGFAGIGAAMRKKAMTGPLAAAS